MTIRKREPRWLFMVLGVLAVLVVILFQRTTGTHHLIMPISMVVLIIGMFVEHRLIAEDWRSVLALAVGACILGFVFQFIGGGSFTLERTFQRWSYWFIGFFLLIAVLSYSEKLITRIDEGMTLLLTLALVYWAFDHDLFDSPRPWLLGILVIAGLFSTFAFLNAFLPFTLSGGNRLLLSMWNSAVMLFLSCDNIRCTLRLGDIEAMSEWSSVLPVTVSYFLLGVSSIYMAHELILLVGFLPWQGSFFNRAYFRRLRELNQVHIERYSEEQLPFMRALLCVSFAFAFFWMNMEQGWMRSNMAIWTVFLIFPWVLDVARRMGVRRA